MSGLTIRLWLQQKKGLSPHVKDHQITLGAKSITMHYQRLCTYDENIRCYLPYLLSNIYYSLKTFTLALPFMQKNSSI